MLASSLREKRPGLMDVVTRWWNDWSRAGSGAAELDAIGANDLRRIAQDVGTSVAELRSLAAHGAQDADLLLRRMDVLHLDPRAVTRTEPAVFRDLQRLCTLCQVKGRCARDFGEHAHDPAWQGWQDYCPNAGMLNMLVAVGAGRTDTHAQDDGASGKPLDRPT